MSTNSVNNTEKNRGTPEAPAGNNEKGSSTGLVVAGLVTIVGSWVGMAAYMDYRLESVEQKISTEYKQVMSAYENGNAGINQHFTNVTAKVNETSSVLAKGILELTQKGDERFNQMMQGINTNNAALDKNGKDITAALDKSLKDSEKQITSLLSRNQATTENEIAKAIASITEKQDVKNQAIAETIAGLKTESTEQGKAMISALEGVNKNIGETRSGLLTQIDNSNKSLTELIKLSNDAQPEKLTQLASSMTEEIKADSKKYSAEISALAQRLNTVQQQVTHSQNTIQELSKIAPDLRENSAKQVAALNQIASTLDQRMQENLSLMEKKVASLSATLDNTANTLMKSLYSATEGLEGTKVELKSELVSRNKETQDGLKALAQAIQQINAVLESLKENVAKKTSVSQSSGSMADKMKELNDISNAVKILSEKMNALRMQIAGQIIEAKARAKNVMEKVGASDQSQSISEVLNQFNRIAEDAAGQLDTFTKSLTGVSDAVALISQAGTGDKAVSVLTETKSTPEKVSQSAAESGKALNPEERPETKTNNSAR